MSFKLRILKKAEKDFEWFRKNSKPDFIKCFDLLRNTAQTHGKVWVSLKG